MQIIREFHHKFIEVSHFKIGIKLPKLWNLEVQFWGPVLKPTGNTKKSNMKMCRNLDHRLKDIFECRLLENSTTNSLRYHTSKSGSNYTSYGI